MRQADGTELLGANDPRSASIGIIYVSPNDDRPSVLTAILIQDKLGRKQVVIVLPEQNKAFQHAFDFDGLKSMRRGLQVQIVFVAPTGPGPAEFARQRRFPVYSSLESYAEVLRAESSTQEEGEETQRRWLFGRREKSQRADPETPAPVAVDTTEDERIDTIEDERTQPLPGDLMAVPAQVPAEGGSEAGDEDTQHIPTDAIDEAEKEQEFPLVAPTTYEDRFVPLEVEGEPESDTSPEVDSDPDTGVITFHQPVSEPPSSVPPALAPPSVVPARPLSRSSFPAFGGNNRRFLLIGAVILLLLLVGGYLISSIFFSTPLSATVTITPGSRVLRNTYVISAVLGTSDASRRQVQARLLLSTPTAQSRTVNATGTGSVPATQAMGFLTFYNSTTTVQAVAANTVFVGADGVEVVNNEATDIPAANPPTEGSAIVPAHAIKPGASGNIPALDINGACCSNGVIVRNVTAFSGGQDAQSYTYVQQGDIDDAANSLEAALMQNAQAGLQKQIHENEQLAGSPQCSPDVTSNHNASDKAANVTVSVTMTCVGEVYDRQGAVLMSEGLLKGEASNTLGAGYALVGNVVTTVVQVTVAKNGVVAVPVDAEGEWVYQFSDAQKKMMARLIAGKSLKDAMSLLQSQAGVSKATIQLSKSGGDALPVDASRITIVIESVPGVQGPSATPVSTPTT